MQEGHGALLLLTGEVRQDWARLPAPEAGPEPTLAASPWRIAAMEFVSLHAARLSDDAESLRCLIPLGETV